MEIELHAKLCLSSFTGSVHVPRAQNCKSTLGACASLLLLCGTGETGLWPTAFTSGVSWAC